MHNKGRNQAGQVGHRMSSNDTINIIAQKNLNMTRKPRKTNEKSLRSFAKTKNAIKNGLGWVMIGEKC